MSKEDASTLLIPFECSSYLDGLDSWFLHHVSQSLHNLMRVPSMMATRDFLFRGAHTFVRAKLLHAGKIGSEIICPRSRIPRLGGWPRCRVSICGGYMARRFPDATSSSQLPREYRPSFAIRLQLNPAKSFLTKHRETLAERREQPDNFGDC
jgi:hypothetical protein